MSYYFFDAPWICLRQQRCVSGRFAHAQSSLSFFPGQCGRRTAGRGRDFRKDSYTKVKEDEKSWHKTVISSIASLRHWTWHPSSWRSCHLRIIDFCHLYQLEDIMPGNGWELPQSSGIACWILNPALGDAVGIVFRVYNQYMRGGLLDYTRARADPLYFTSHLSMGMSSTALIA